MEERARQRLVFAHLWRDRGGLSGALFSSESSVQNNRCSSRTWVFQMPNEKFLIDSVEIKSKSTAVSVMLWAGFSYEFKTDLHIFNEDEPVRISSQDYQDCLEDHILPISEPDMLFQQDKPPIHIFHSPKDFLKKWNLGTSVASLLS